MTAELVHVYPHAHLLGVAGLSRLDAEALLARADAFADAPDDPAHGAVLRGRSVLSLFFESSTRTQASFEMAARRLGASVAPFAVSASSLAKGETLYDMLAALDALAPDIVVIRHGASGAAAFAAAHMRAGVVNAGDGWGEHPTQAFLDALALRRALNGLEGRRIAICGDIRHSRVARSNILLLQLLGAEVRLFAPPNLWPPGAEDWGAERAFSLEAAIAGCDAVMMLRLQRERMEGGFIPSAREYFDRFGLTRARLAKAKPGAVVLHPGPVNRGVEIASDLVDDGARTLILSQVALGVPVRMAALDLVAANLAQRGRGNRR